MAESAKDVAERLAGPHGRTPMMYACVPDVCGPRECDRPKRVAAIEAAIREAEERGRGLREIGDRLAPMMDFLDIADGQRQRADHMLKTVMAIRNVLREVIGDDAWRSDDAGLPKQIADALAEARRQGREDAEPKQAEVDAIYQRMRQAEFKAEDLLERVRTLEEMLSRQHLEHPGRPKSACAVCSLLAASKTLPKAASQEMRAEAVRRIRAIRALPLDGPGETGKREGR